MTVSHSSVYFVETGFQDSQETKIALPSLDTLYFIRLSNPWEIHTHRGNKEELPLALPKKML